MHALEIQNNQKNITTQDIINICNIQKVWIILWILVTQRATTFPGKFLKFDNAAYDFFLNVTNIKVAEVTRDDSFATTYVQFQNISEPAQKLPNSSYYLYKPVYLGNWNWSLSNLTP